MAIRGVLLGITLNLGDYENLRLEVTADSFAEAAVVVDETLGQIQQKSTEATACRIERYRRRVIAAIVTGKQEAQAETPVGQPVVKPAPTTRAEAPREDATKEPPSPAKTDAPLITCDSCGEGVTESQQKLSQLFTGKCLCKTCLGEASGSTTRD